MNNKISKSRLASGCCSLMLLLVAIPNTANAVNLNYENLSSLQEPIATHIGDTTVRLTGLVDGAVDVNSDDKDAVLNSNFQINAETQLDNSLTVGAAYFGDYDSAADDRYDDNAAVYVGGVLGTVSAGDVTGMVREDTRRNRGVGNAELNYDESLGQLDDRGVAYIGRYGPLKISTTVDKDGHFDVGATFQRPLGNKDYRFSTQFRNAELETNDAIVLDSKSVSVIAELTFGSTVYDVGIGVERLENNIVSADRKFLSLGLARKLGVITISAEVHVGDIEGQDELAYAIGASYDIARGLSLNLGINYSDSEVSVDGVEIRADDSTEAIVSARYSL